MKKMNVLFMVIGVLVICSCNDDQSTVELTYTKATAVYGDLDEYRTVPIMGAIREIADPGKIFISESLLLIGEEGEGIHVFDNADATNPMPMGFINIPNNHEFFVENNILYAESYFDMLKIDISSPHAIEIIDRVEDVFANDFLNEEGQHLLGFEYETVTELLDEDDHLYEILRNNDNNMAFFDHDNSIIPPSIVPSSFAGSSTGGAGTINRIAYHDDHVYVISKSDMYLFEDKGALAYLETRQNIAGNMETIIASDSKLFIGSRRSMEVFDISIASDPSLISSFWHGRSCDPVYPSGEVVYVTLRAGDVSSCCQGTTNALVVLEISSSMSNPRELQEIAMTSPYGLTLIDTKLYVGEGENGLRIFDASNKKSLSQEAYLKDVAAYDVIAHPTLDGILLIAGPEGLTQYTIDGSSQLELISSIDF